MATITIPTVEHMPYVFMFELIQSNPDRWFVIELDAGVTYLEADDALTCYSELAPGEGFTVLAVCDTEIEATRFHGDLSIR